MFDPLAQQLSVGGTLGLGFAWLLLKFKPWVNGSRPSEALGAAWREQMRVIVRDAVHDIFISRNEDLRRMLHDEVKAAVRETMQYFYGLRGKSDD